MTSTFISLFLLNMNGARGFSFFDEEAIMLFYTYVVLIHTFGLIAYYSRTSWLQILCALLYLPMFLVPLILLLFDSMFLLLFIPIILFFALVIARTRK